MKTFVNAFSLIKQSCDLVTLKIIKVSYIKVKLWPNSDQAYRCNDVNTRNVIIHEGFEKRAYLDIVIEYDLPDILCWECKCTELVLTLLSFLNFAYAGFTGIEYA